MTVVTRPQKQLAGKIRIESALLVKTGLHIGGGGETLDIGGLDKPVIRDPLTQQPYLPGSSIKGKLRSILERLHNKPVNRKGSRDTYRYESDDLVDGYTEINAGQFVSFMGASNCPVSRIFGSTGIKCWIRTTDITDDVEADAKILKQTIAVALPIPVVPPVTNATLFCGHCPLYGKLLVASVEETSSINVHLRSLEELLPGAEVPMQGPPH
jgi:CRISPR-associated protein Csm3